MIGAQGWEGRGYVFIETLFVGLGGAGAHWVAASAHVCGGGRLLSFAKASGEWSALPRVPQRVFVEEEMWSWVL